MAKLRSVEDAIRSCGQDRTLLYIEGLSTLGIASSTDPDAPQVKVKKCAYPMFIDSVLKQMLMSAPTNETFRARLMAKVGEMPPKEADTWQKLVEWVEWNFPKAGSTTGLGPITASCRYRETELGRCYYSRIMRSHGVVAMTPDMIKDCANAAEDNGQFWEFIHDKFMELAERITQAEEPCTMTTSDYDPSDAKDKSWDYDKRALELKVRTCLGQILSSEQIEDLEL
jgi:hypothetical protein